MARPESLDDLATEAHASGDVDYDLRSTRELVELMNDGDAHVPAAVGAVAAELAQAIDAIVGRLGVSERDAVVGVSASGRTPYVLGALGAAVDTGALTVGIACSPGSELAGI